MELEVSGLYVYPVKSLGGITLQSAQLNESGIEYDRNWMLVDDNHQMITQRAIPQLALFALQFTSEGIQISYQQEQIAIPFENPNLTEEIMSSIWGTDVYGLKEEDRINQWFSRHLGQPVYLLRVAAQQPRFVKKHEDTKVNFPDSNQYLILGEGSLQHLNDQLEQPIPINRFRANIVFKGGAAHVEDEWKAIRIGNLSFDITKSCGRCKMITNDQETGVMGKEPLRTLSTYRVFENKVLFGRYLKLVGTAIGQISVGDKIVVDTLI